MSIKALMKLMTLLALIYHLKYIMTTEILKTFSLKETDKLPSIFSSDK